MSYKWRVLCTVHGWQYGWSDDELTECPIDSSDPLVSERVYRVGEEVPVMVVIPSITRVNSSGYARVASVFYNGEHHGPLYRVKVYSSMDVGISSYNVELYNRDTHSSLIEATFTNIGDIQSSDLGLLPSPIEGIVNIEVNMKRTGGGNNNYVNIEQIIFFTRKERE